MKNKTAAVRREILKTFIPSYGNKPKNIVVKLAKEKGIYSYDTPDDEVYNLIKCFADFHKMPFGYIESIKTKKENDLSFVLTPDEDIEKEPEKDIFYESLIKQRNTLSRQLLALNKLIDTYEL